MARHVRQEFKELICIHLQDLIAPTFVFRRPRVGLYEVIGLDGYFLKVTPEVRYYLQSLIMETKPFCHCLCNS